MTALSNSRTVRTVAINDPKPYANNALTYPRKLLRKIEALVRRHEQIPTILVTSDMTIVSGEEWWLALKNAGKTEVKVEILADLSPAEANTVRLALGRLPLDARLDPKRLRAEFSALQAQGIDLDLTGFDQAEIDLSLEIDMPRANVTENFDFVPKRQDRAVSKLGDVFQLRVHRIGCGDARDQALVDRLRDGREAAVCITDPPYNLKISGFGFGKSRHGQGDFVEASGEMSKLEFYSLTHDWLKVLRSSSSQSALIYAFMDWRHILELLAAGSQLRMPLLNLCVWSKSAPGMGGLYRSQHELIAVFKAGSEPHRNNVELGKFGRNRSNVWATYDVPSVRKDELLGSHPTVKPVAMLADILRDCTKRGDLVLDPFLGSGSGLISAEETGRACVGVELDPYYIDVTIRRWQAITGRDAIHVATGQRFDDIAQRLLTHTEISHGA
jgi:DNA modification methylase